MVFTYSKTGIFHEEHKLEKQDEVYHKENNRYAILCQADGVSMCINGRRGAQISCLETASILSGNEEAFFRFSSRKTAYLVLEQAVCRINGEAKKYGELPESYASTLIFCCIDKQLRKALLFNLGDGAICRISGGKCSYLIPPDRISGSLCPQTMTKDAFKAAAVKIIDLGKESSIFMCTDGLLHEIKNEDYGMSVRNNIRDGNYHALVKALGLIPNTDDISFMAYRMEDSKDGPY